MRLQNFSREGRLFLEVRLADADDGLRQRAESGQRRACALVGQRRFTLREKLWLAGVPTPLLAVIVIG
jgi:hypothetical protein